MYRKSVCARGKVKGKNDSHFWANREFAGFCPGLQHLCCISPANRTVFYNLPPYRESAMIFQATKKLAQITVFLYSIASGVRRHWN